jgi:hypothetical protein
MVTSPSVSLSAMLRPFLIATALSVVVLVSGSAAASAATCSAPKYPGSGYFTSLKVTKVSCSTGKKVTLAHYKCRVKHGKTGRCVSKVLGYSCRETRRSISTEIDGTVTCKRGSKKVVYSYQQDT